MANVVNVANAVNVPMYVDAAVNMTKGSQDGSDNDVVGGNAQKVVGNGWLSG